MASLLAVSSLLWILPPPSLAWTPPPPLPIAAKKRRASSASLLCRPPPPRSHCLWASTLPTMTTAAAAAAATTKEDGGGSSGGGGAESLDVLTVPELKERLRAAGQKVTGKKSELIERLLIQQQQNGVDHTTKNNVADEISHDPSLDQLPQPLREALVRLSASGATPSSSAGPPKLLPIQQKSYQVIADGQDAVLFSPTGTGKTLGFVLPLAARLWEWKHDGSLKHQKKAQMRRFMRRRNGRDDGNDSMPMETKIEAATPTILIVEPSRELARQVGKVCSKFHPTATRSNKRQVVTVYGGVPMARQAALLGSKTDIVIGTPGRIRELIREKYLSTSQVRSVVLDEADTLLNFKDNPEVEWLIDGMMNDYQLVLASATINRRVERFVGNVMELEVGEEGYVVVEGHGTDAADVDDGGIDIDGQSTPDGIQVAGVESGPHTDDEHHAVSGSPSSQPVVNHWSMPASAASRVTLASDLIVTISPRRGIIFVPSKSEVESVAQELIERLSSANDVSVHTLHGDMVQAARSRTVNAFRADTKKMTRILVATDVASRGLDLPAVDLVLQFGVPRVTGKDGTYDSELYIHRTGRAGRFGNTRTADAILLYDPSQGERTTLMKLEGEVKNLQSSIDIMPRQLPSPSEVMEASYDRAMLRCEEYGRSAQTEDARDGTESLVQYFTARLSNDLKSDECFEVAGNERESFLVHRLASAMAALSGLDGIVPPRSLLTADPGDRTIRVWNDSLELSPPEVTKVVKALGSGKLGRISIRDDGSAVFDLSAKKAELVLTNAGDDTGLKSSGWHFNMPSSLE